MRKWEWIGVTLTKESRSKKNATLQPTTTLLERVTFSQPYGEIVSVIEDSETVREQFQQLLLGEKTPSDGLILGYSETAIALRLASLTMQQQTGKAYCQSYFRSKHLSKSQCIEKVSACHQFSELGERFNAPISDYCLSEKAQLLASVSLYSDANLICLDDYVIWTSAPFLVKVMSRLTELKEKGASIWLFTDQLTKIGRYCDHVIWLQFGRLRDYDRPKDVQERYETYLTNFYAMDSEARQVYWDQGLASQVHPLKEKLSVEKELTVKSLMEEPLIEEGSSLPARVEKSGEEDSPSRSDPKTKRNQSTQLSKRPHPIVQAWKAVALGASVLCLSVGGGYLAAFKYLTNPSLSHLPVKVAVSSTTQEPTPPSESVTSQHSETRLPPSDSSSNSISEVPEVALFTHVVVPGDSLSGLATLYEVNVSELMAVNGLTDETIAIGETLSLPSSAKENSQLPPSESGEADGRTTLTPPTQTESSQQRESSYIVVQGDTLFQIARRYGKTVLDLQKANGLQTPELSPGQLLNIPN